MLIVCVMAMGVFFAVFLSHCKNRWEIFPIICLLLCGCASAKKEPCFPIDTGKGYYVCGSYADYELAGGRVEKIEGRIEVIEGRVEKIEEK